MPQASMPPSAVPAPTMACTSSMNKITSPARCTSSNTFLNRSSKSPRYLVPATRLVMSSERMRLPRSWGGTCPAAMRRASPSTTAVLPTPGSPTRQGLFLRRRTRICSMRSNSLSRPSTGSSLSCSARLVRSLPYFSAARAAPRGLVTGRGVCWNSGNLPMRRPHSFAAAAGSTPSCTRMRPAVAGASSSAASRCTGSTFPSDTALASITAQSTHLESAGVKSLGERRVRLPQPTCSRSSRPT